MTAELQWNVDESSGAMIEEFLAGVWLSGFLLDVRSLVWNALSH